MRDIQVIQIESRPTRLSIEQWLLPVPALPKTKELMHVVRAVWLKKDGSMLLLGIPCKSENVAFAYVRQLEEVNPDSDPCWVRVINATLIKIIPHETY